MDISNLKPGTIVSVKRGNGKLIKAKLISKDERGVWVRLINFHNTEVCVAEVHPAV